MTYLTALLPVAQGVAVYAALLKNAATLTAAGDARTRGQLMADEPVTRVTQPSVAGTDQPADLPAGTSLDIHLVMTDKTLLAADPEPAVLVGYGPIPAPVARRLVCGADEKAKVWVRRLFTDPAGTLVDGDPTRRLFPRAAREFLVARDQTCRTPWCDAPIRHADHIEAHSGGGATDIRNGQGLCEGCNQRKHTGIQLRADPPPPPGAVIRRTRRPKKHAVKAKRIYLLPPAGAPRHLTAGVAICHARQAFWGCWPSPVDSCFGPAASAAAPAKRH